MPLTSNSGLFHEVKQAARRAFPNLCDAIQDVPCAFIRHYNRRHAATFDPRRTIVICGVPRGGTTWLAEVLASLRDTTIVWEPLSPWHPTKRKMLRKSLDYQRDPEARFWWRPYIPEDADWPEAQEYFQRLLTGQILHRGILYKNPVLLRRTHHFLVKFCRANRLLPWFVTNFDVPPPIFLIRHPCAVVASRHRHHDIAPVEPPYRIIPGRYSHDFYQPHREYLASLSTREEIHAAQWCLDQLVPLRHPQNGRAWITVSYERLVKEGPDELGRLFKRLQLPVPRNVEPLLRQPSGTTVAGSPILSGGDQLAGWRKHLSAAQVLRILNVVAHFGLDDIYSDALEPDYRKLGCDDHHGSFFMTSDRMRRVSA